MIYEHVISYIFITFIINFYGNILLYFKYDTDCHTNIV